MAIAINVTQVHGTRRHSMALDGTQWHSPGPIALNGDCNQWQSMALTWSSWPKSSRRRAEPAKFGKGGVGSGGVVCLERRGEGSVGGKGRGTHGEIRRGTRTDRERRPLRSEASPPLPPAGAPPPRGFPSNDAPPPGMCAARAHRRRGRPPRRHLVLERLPVRSPRQGRLPSRSRRWAWDRE